MLRKSKRSLGGHTKQGLGWKIYIGGHCGKQAIGEDVVQCTEHRHGAGLVKIPWYHKAVGFTKIMEKSPKSLNALLFHETAIPLGASNQASYASVVRGKWPRIGRDLLRTSAGKAASTGLVSIVSPHGPNYRLT